LVVHRSLQWKKKGPYRVVLLQPPVGDVCYSDAIVHAANNSFGSWNEYNLRNTQLDLIKAFDRTGEEGEGVGRLEDWPASLFVALHPRIPARSG